MNKPSWYAKTFISLWKTALKRKPKGPLLGCKRKKIILCQNIEIWNGWKTGLSKAEGVSCSEEKESSTQCWWEEESGNTFVVVPSSVNRKEKKHLTYTSKTGAFSGKYGKARNVCTELMWWTSVGQILSCVSWLYLRDWKIEAPGYICYYHWCV